MMNTTSAKSILRRLVQTSEHQEQALVDLIKNMEEINHSDDDYHHGESILQHIEEVLFNIRSIAQDLPPKRRLVLKLAAILHDIGKTITAQRQGNRVTFHGHAQESARMSRALLERYRDLLGDMYDQIVQLVEMHDYFLSLANAANKEGKTYVRRFMRSDLYQKGLLDDLVRLAKADSMLSKTYDKTLKDIEQILADIAYVEAQNQKKEQEKKLRQERFKRMLPEIQQLLREEGLPEIAKLSDQSKILKQLHLSKRIDLIRRITKMIG